MALAAGADALVFKISSAEVRKLNAVGTIAGVAVTFVSGQAEDSVSATYGVNIFSSNATNYGYAGLALDATNAGTVIGGVQGSSSTVVSVSPTLAVVPQVGRHFIQATEISVSGTTTYSGGAGLMQLSARLRY